MMSKGLRWFAIFCGMIVAAMVAVTLYLGPNVLSFLFHDERDTAPFVMIDFVEFDRVDGDNVAASDRYRDQYRRPLLSLVATLGGAVVWQGGIRRVIEGRPDDDWDALLMVRYPSREVFVDMVTSSAYRDLMAARSGAVRRQLVIAATPFVEFTDTRHAASLMLTHGFVDEEARVRYQEEHLAALIESAKKMGGEVVWHAMGNPLSADPKFAWTDVLILGFPTELQLSRWAHHPVWRSRQALARPLMERWALVELEASP